MQAQAPNFCASVLHRSAALCHFQYQPENPETQTLQWRRASGGGEGGRGGEISLQDLGANSWVHREEEGEGWGAPFRVWGGERESE